MACRDFEVSTSPPLATCHIRGANSSYWPNTMERLRSWPLAAAPNTAPMAGVEPSSTTAL